MFVRFGKQYRGVTYSFCFDNIGCFRILKVQKSQRLIFRAVGWRLKNKNVRQLHVQDI